MARAFRRRRRPARARSPRAGRWRIAARAVIAAAAAYAAARLVPGTPSAPAAVVRVRPVVAADQPRRPRAAARPLTARSRKRGARGMREVKSAYHGSQAAGTAAGQLTGKEFMQVDERQFKCP